MEDLVSVIMPSYNTAEYISESIVSVLNQTYTNLELIIVDDCSNDNTDKIIKNFLNDKRIIYIKNRVNSGAAISRNKALRIAKGRWIAFLDSDDLWDRDKIHKQISFMKDNNYHFSYTNYKEIDSEGNELNVKITGPQIITKVGMDNYCWPGCLTVMYDAKFYGLLQIKDIRKNNDYAMWLQLSKKSNCYLLEEYLAFYRHGRNGSISTHSFWRLIIWHYKLWHEIEEYNIILSIVNTIRNMFFGTIKKIFYTKRNNR